MKRMSHKLILAAVLVTVLNFQSCKKYDDGPSFTLKTKKSRLVGEWEVVKITDNQGQVIFPNNNSGGGYGYSYSYTIEKYDLEFEKDGDVDLDVVVTFETPYGNFTDASFQKGEWEFSSDKEELEIELDNFIQDWEIKRLTNDEFWFEDQQGNEWELDAK